MVRTRLLLFAAMLAHVSPLAAGEVLVPDAKDKNNGVIPCTEGSFARHNPSLARPYDIRVCFEGYELSFISKPAADGEPYRIPAFVVHRIEPSTAKLKTGNKRPKWVTVPQLEERGLAAPDASYNFAATFRKKDPDWYQRGHLAAKNVLERLGWEPAYYTHTTVNAVPQRARFKAPGWLDLECRTGAWASREKDAPLRVIAGPVFLAGEPERRLYAPDGKRETKANSIRRKPPSVAIPDRLFKVVVRERGGKFEALGFLFPQTEAIYAKPPKDQRAEKFLVSIDRLEKLTELTLLRDTDGEPLPGTEATRKGKGKLWPHAPHDFDKGCRTYAKEG